MAWQPNPGTPLNNPIVTEACACVESMASTVKGSSGGTSGKRWRSSLAFYRVVQRDQAVPFEATRDFIGIGLHDHPDKFYFVVRMQRLVVEADASMQALIDKLQSYKPRIVLYFEGLQYQLGDFVVKVGKCVQASSEALRGIMMEVEYLPLSSLEKSRQVMEEFMDLWQETISKKALTGHFVHVETNLSDYGLDEDHYTPQHTAVQYASCMAQLIAAVRP